MINTCFETLNASRQVIPLIRRELKIFLLYHGLTLSKIKLKDNVGFGGQCYIFADLIRNVSFDRYRR